MFEFRENIGANLIVLGNLFPNINDHGVEINDLASQELTKILDKKNSYTQSIESYDKTRKYDLVFAEGV